MTVILIERHTGDGDPDWTRKRGVNGTGDGRQAVNHSNDECFAGGSGEPAMLFSYRGPQYADSCRGDPCCTDDGNGYMVAMISNGTAEFVAGLLCLLAI